MLMQAFSTLVCKENQIKNFLTLTSCHVLRGIMSYSFYACETDVTKATFNKDIFEREKYADNLTKLVHKTTCPYVIALSSPWGHTQILLTHLKRQSI